MYNARPDTESILEFAMDRVQYYASEFEGSVFSAWDGATSVDLRMCTYLVCSPTATTICAVF